MSGWPSGAGGDKALNLRVTGEALPPCRDGKSEPPLTLAQLPAERRQVVLEEERGER